MRKQVCSWAAKTKTALSGQRKFSDLAVRRYLPIIALVLTIGFRASAQSCDPADKIPSDANQVADGVVSSSPFSAKFTGGQSVFVKVRNDTVHFTPMTVTVLDGGTAHKYCSSSVTIPPQKTLIFTTAVLGEEVYWGIRVEPGDVDVVQLSVNVFTRPPAKAK